MITKYGTVTISEDEVLIEGFTIDASLGKSFPDAGNEIITWAIEALKDRLTKLGFFPTQDQDDPTATDPAD